MMGKGQLCQRHGKFLRYLFAVTCALLPLLTAMTATVSAADPPTVQSTVTHAGTLVGRTNAQQQVTLAVPLKITRQNDLDAFLRDLYNPTSPAFRHYLTPAEFTKRFVDAKARQQVGDFLRGEQLTVTDNGLGTVINATGTVAQMERAFNVTLSDYRDSAGRVYYGNDRTAALPASIAALTHGIIGLDNASADAPHFMEAPSQPQQTSPSEAPRTPSGCVAAITTATLYGSFTPNQLSTAYNFDFLATNGLHGEGQTVALFEADNYLDSNVAAYQTCFGTTVPVTRVPVDGGATLGESDGEIEVELDIDVIVGMAPRLAQLLVYNSPNNQASAIDQYQQIATDNIAQVVSTSWGNCEPNRTASVLNARYAIFQQMATQGQSMFAAAGDSGSEDCESGSTNAIVVDDPASQPFVTGVGGTRLAINAVTNQYSSETVWNRYPSGGAGGGGISIIWPKPSYQVGPGTVNAFSNGKRQVPDIAADADPSTGYTVFVHSTSFCPSRNGGANDCFAPIGGTSASAPFWAAATALTNQMLASNSWPRVGFVNAQLYPLLANVSNPSATRPFPFHDITVGDNCLKPASGCGSPNSGSGRYPATAAYDQASGIGSMNAGALALAMASPVVSSLSRSAGQAAGGTSVTITGNFFQAGATVLFGDALATNVSVVSATQITATTPAHALGTVDVTVTNLSGRSGVGVGLFTYVPGPAITSVSPGNGGTGGGTAITITGTLFQAGATVTIGGAVASSVVVVNATQVTCVTPAHPLPGGAMTLGADVTVTNPDGSFGTMSGGFTYQLRPGPSIPNAQPQPAPPPRA